jgi:hypothetical protein
MAINYSKYRSLIILLMAVNGENDIAATGLSGLPARRGECPRKSQILTRVKLQATVFA